MKKLMYALMVFSLVLAVVSLVAAAELPQALQGVDLSKAKQVADQEAQEVRGSANAYSFNFSELFPGEGEIIPGDDIQNLWGEPGPHGLGLHKVGPMN